MNEYLRALEFIRSLGFSGLLGAGVVGLLPLVAPGLLPATVPFWVMLLTGGCLGSGAYGVLQAFFSPTLKYVSFYFKLIQLLSIRRFLGEGEFKAGIKRLTHDSIFAESSKVATPPRVVVHPKEPSIVNTPTASPQRRPDQVDVPFRVRETGKPVGRGGFGKGRGLSGSLAANSVTDSESLDESAPMSTQNTPPPIPSLVLTDPSDETSSQRSNHPRRENQ